MDTSWVKSLALRLSRKYCSLYQSYISLNGGPMLTANMNFILQLIARSITNKECCPNKCLNNETKNASIWFNSFLHSKRLENRLMCPCSNFLTSLELLMSNELRTWYTKETIRMRFIIIKAIPIVLLMFLEPKEYSQK